MTMTKVIVTGSGSGIGKEFTKLFLADGSRVLAVSLIQHELDQLRTELDPTRRQLNTLQMDLSAADAAESLYAWCEQNDWMPDILVNNAGFGCYGDTVDLNPDRIASMLALNITTLTQTSMLFGRVMKRRGRGRILNVGSTAGMIPTPRLAGYCASKSYVNTFSFALAAELKPHGVTVTCLTPGATQTNFAKAGDIDSFQGKSALKDMFAKGQAGSPKDVAMAGYRGLMSGRRHVLAGKGAGLGAWISRLIAPSRLPGLMRNI